MGHRMKPFLSCVVVLALFASSPALGAPGDKWTGPHFGASLPSGDFSTSARSGFEAGWRFNYLKADHVGLGVDVSYHGWDGTDALESGVELFTGPGSRFTLNALQTTANVFYAVPSGGKSRPYVTGGFGFYWFRAHLASPRGSATGEWQQNFGYNAGVGSDFDMSPRVAIALDGRYHLVQSVGDMTKFFTFDVSVMRRIGVK
jgi:opacity protein-like surface antigen